MVKKLFNKLKLSKILIITLITIGLFILSSCSVVNLTRENLIDENDNNKSKSEIKIDSSLEAKDSQPVSGKLYEVVRVVDGDTIIVNINSKHERVRLIGINTPESVKPNHPVEKYGKEASNFMKNLLKGKKVRLEFDVQKRDKYNRLLAYVYLEDGTMVNKLLLQEGYAQVMTVPPNVKYQEEFLKLQRKAREQGKGLWKEGGKDGLY